MSDYQGGATRLSGSSVPQIFASTTTPISGCGIAETASACAICAATRIGKEKRHPCSSRLLGQAEGPEAEVP